MPPKTVQGALRSNSNKATTAVLFPGLDSTPRAQFTAGATASTESTAATSGTLSSSIGGKPLLALPLSFASSNHAAHDQRWHSLPCTQEGASIKPGVG